jgi:hypothetical protein
MRFVIASILLSAFTFSAQQLDIDSYHAKLAQSCGSKHLEMLPPAELLGVVDSFSQTLTIPQQATLHAARIASCNQSPGGAACENTGFLQAAAAMGVLDQFVSRVCALPKTCTRQSACTKQ